MRPDEPCPVSQEHRQLCCCPVLAVASVQEVLDCCWTRFTSMCHVQDSCCDMLNHLAHQGPPAVFHRPPGLHSCQLMLCTLHMEQARACVNILGNHLASIAICPLCNEGHQWLFLWCDEAAHAQELFIHNSSRYPTTLIVCSG